MHQYLLHSDGRFLQYGSQLQLILFTGVALQGEEVKWLGLISSHITLFQLLHHYRTCLRRELPACHSRFDYHSALTSSDRLWGSYRCAIEKAAGEFSAAASSYSMYFQLYSLVLTVVTIVVRW